MRSKPQNMARTELQRAAKRLQPKKITCPADRSLGELESEILLAHVLKKDRTWIHAHDEKALSMSQTKRFHDLVARRKRHEPIAYILGEKEFYGLPFKVTPAVLIPRPASETIVDLIRGTKTKQPPLVLDVGTGSGAIALAVAANVPDAKVVGTDVSAAALRLATSNAARLGIKNASFVKADLLARALTASLKTNTRPLFLTVNLPYLPVSDKKKLQPDVVRYEPHGALFGGKDGNDLIVAFLGQLKKSGIRFRSVFLEFDSPQACTLTALAKKSFPGGTVRIHKDLDGKNRVLEITQR